jgi:hypothetical protein
MTEQLTGAQRMVLQAIHDLPKDATGYVTDAQIAQSTHLAIGDVRDLLETIERKKYVNVAPTEVGHSAEIIAEGRLALRRFTPPQESISAQASARPINLTQPGTVVFDEAHGQQGWFERPTADAGLKSAADYLGERFRINRNTRSFSELRGLGTESMMVFPTPFRSAVSGEEYDALAKWVFAGNGLLMLGFYLMETHHRFNVNDLAHTFGFDFLHNLIMPVGKESLHDCMDQAFGVSKDLCVFARPTGAPAGHPLLSGVERLAIQSACSVEPASACELVVSTEEECSIMRATGRKDDTGRMYRIEKYHIDKKSKANVMLAVKYGSGRVIGIGSRKVFENECLDDQGTHNRRLLHNCAEWLLRQS